MFPNCAIVCVGDFNFDILNILNSIQRVNQDNINLNLNNFINNYSLKACSAGMSKNKNILNYTYRHETLDHLSYIDYF